MGQILDPSFKLREFSQFAGRKKARIVLQQSYAQHKAYNTFYGIPNI